MNTKVKFINTCDVMLHARQVGESFGLSCAEFSIRNKPIITYLNSPERNHIDTLGEKGIYFETESDILHILRNLDKEGNKFFGMELLSRLHSRKSFSKI